MCHSQDPNIEDHHNFYDRALKQQATVKLYLIHCI